jgi:hypothetical protein
MNGYPDEVIQKVWEKARMVAFASPDEWRLDHRGAWISRPRYRDIKSPFGWHIEHTTAGCDLLANLRPGNIQQALGTHAAHGPAAGTDFRWLLRAGGSASPAEGK